VTKDRQLTDTVLDFLDRAGPMHARMEEERFKQEMHQNCLEVGMESPIEDLFWISCWLLCKARYSDLNPDPEITPHGPELPDGMYVTPQAKVGKFRVDFLIDSKGFGPKEHLPPVIVELDGHAFHDKDKRQRSYEKGRDRALVRAGYRVIHFTGSDVVKDPFACAWEALELAGLFVGTGITEYDPANPLSLDEYGGPL
jgi:very-short-patch-repair endonuclease